MKEIIIQRNWKIWDKNFYEEIQQELEALNEGESVCIDFGEIHELDGEFMPVIFILVHHVYEKTKKQVFFSNVNPEISSYLESMRFFQRNYVRASKLRYIGEIKHDNRHRFIPVYRIYDEDSIRDFNRRSQDILSLGSVEQELKESVSMVLKELIANGQEHSVENSLDMLVYAFGTNEEDRINLAVVDFGMGFYNSLLRNKNNLYRIKNSKDAIREVLTNHITAREDECGGMGYAVIEEIIDAYNGRLLIVSGNAVIAYGKEIKKSVQEMTKEMSGSIIFLQLEKGY